MKANLVMSGEQLEKVAPILLQLRPQYSQESLIQQIQKQQEQGYQLLFIERNDVVLCVAGFVIAEKLAWEKHLYVDDLVTNENHRSSGAGGFAIDWLVGYAREMDCKQIHLDSGVQRFAAHKFYLNKGFNIASHHFSKTL